MSTTEEANPYELLGINSEATEQEIKSAYRQRSLKVHPDRNPGPHAARQFHELNQAYELLLDPLRKLALDAKLRLKQARAQRFASYDAKRKNLVAELEEREEAFKKAKVAQKEKEVARLHEEEKIKEEGRKLREEREKELKKRDDMMNKSADDEEMPPEMGGLDTTVRLKYTLTVHPTLTTAASLSTLLTPFGPTDTETIRILLKPPKKAPDKPAKFATAVVEFKQIGDAFAAVCASGRADRGLSGIQIDWVEGKEPAILGWLKKRGVLGVGATAGKSEEKARDEEKKSASTSNKPSFSSFPELPPDFTTAYASMPGLDYESLTFMRMRQAERERLERQIREQEGE